MPKIKNIIIFVAIGAIFVFIYFYFIKSKEETAGLVSSTTAVVPSAPMATAPLGGASGNVEKDFLTLLLGVRGIKLDDAIFTDAAYESLDGTHSITLVPDGNEGRSNPFAPLGSDSLPPTTLPTTTPTSAATGAPVTP